MKRSPKGEEETRKQQGQASERENSHPEPGLEACNDTQVKRQPAAPPQEQQAPCHHGDQGRVVSGVVRMAANASKGAKRDRAPQQNLAKVSLAQCTWEREQTPTG